MRRQSRQMLRRVLLLAVAMTLVASPVAAQAADQPDWAEEAYDDSKSMVSEYNERVDSETLGPASGQLKDEVVNLHVTAADGSEATFAFEMNDEHEIEDLQQGTRDDATLKMTTDRATYQRIASAENPASEFRSAVRGDDVKISGIGAVNGVKWGAINVAADVARGLGGVL